MSTLKNFSLSSPQPASLRTRFTASSLLLHKALHVTAASAAVVALVAVALVGKYGFRVQRPHVELYLELTRLSITVTS
jgi:hypothetical protein